MDTIDARGTVRNGGIGIDLTVGESPSRSAEALLIAQDVKRIMGDSDVVEDTGETPTQVVSACLAARPERLGSVLLASPAEARPMLLELVVYDFEKTPPVIADDVFRALVTAFEVLRSNGVARLALRPIGTSHGGITDDAFIALLRQVCQTATELGTSLRRIEILLPSTDRLRRVRQAFSQLKDGGIAEGVD